MTIPKLFKNTSFLLIISVCFLVTLSACKSSKNVKTSSDGKPYYIAFFIGEEGVQYFLKPITFINGLTGDKLIVDFTFRYKNEVKDSATVNFSIKSPTPIKPVDSLYVETPSFKIVSKAVGYIFGDKLKKGFNTRHTLKIAVADLKLLFNDASWNIVIYSKNSVHKYQPTKPGSKAMVSLKNSVFVLID